MVFDWEPTLYTGAELLASPRGTDVRLQNDSRPNRDERRRLHHDRMDAKAEARAELFREREHGVWTTPDES